MYRRLYHQYLFFPMHLEGPTAQVECHLSDRAAVEMASFALGDWNPIHQIVEELGGVILT